MIPCIMPTKNGNERKISLDGAEHISVFAIQPRPTNKDGSPRGREIRRARDQ